MIFWSCSLCRWVWQQGNQWYTFKTLDSLMKEYEKNEVAKE